MVKPIKPVITILENPEYQLLILGVTLLAFLTMIFFFSKYYYNKNYNVSEVYDAQTGKNNSVITPAGLMPCNKGECVVNKKSGIKKCPSDKNTVLFYDENTQTCSSSSTCPSLVPYAVNSDGSVNLYGTCESDGCRCSTEITCAHFIASKFSIVNGDLFSTYSSDKNFLFEQIPYSENDSYHNSIEIDPSREYCKINSSYSSTLVGGCSFQNQIHDFLMDCSKEELSEGISVSPYSLDPYYLYSSGPIEKQYCEIQPYLDSNWNNMTLCVNQNPCKIGNYTYNYDKYRNKDGKLLSKLVKAKELNSRNFCQSYASNLETYLTDMQFYTLSCIGGVSCNELPNTIDQDKFFASQNQELDISLINASYPVELEKNFLTPKTGNNFTYNPFVDNINSGDLLKVDNDFYIIRVNSKKISLYILDNSSNMTIYEKYDLTNIDSTKSLIFFPQYALNGFGYNTTSYTTNVSEQKIWSYNLENAFSSNNTGRPDNIPFYFPLYSIQINKKFYRSAVSKPAGYVFKQEVQEEIVEEDLTQQIAPTGFSADNYKIKETLFNTAYYNDISFYSPVWNNQYGRSECIRCTPLLVASINMKQISSSGSVSGFNYDVVTIQSSGKDFGHYRKNFLEKDIEKIWCYESLSKINPFGSQSSQNVLYLDIPNVNIKEGDYILSSNGEFNFTIKALIPNFIPSLKGNCKVFLGDIYQNIKGEIENYSPFYDDGTHWIGLGIDDNTYQNFQRGAYITCSYDENGFQITELHLGNLESGKGFLFGNNYKALFSDRDIVTTDEFEKLAFIPQSNVIDVTIVPTVQVDKISPNYDVITTKGYSSKSPFGNSNTIKKSSLIQFISLDRNLYLNNNPKDINNGLPGSKGKIAIDKITNGRITSIIAKPSGSGYTNVSPLVRLKSYDAYFN